MKNPNLTEFPHRWYKRSEAQKRSTFFFSSTSLAGAFGGLLATAIGKMGGVGGYSSWRWIFIIGELLVHVHHLPSCMQLTSGAEGLITVAASILFYFVISDFPEEAKWLSGEEKAFIKQRLSEDVGDSGHHVKYSIQDILGVLKDRECWTSAVVYAIFT